MYILTRCKILRLRINYINEGTEKGFSIVKNSRRKTNASCSSKGSISIKSIMWRCDASFERLWFTDLPWWEDIDTSLEDNGRRFEHSRESFRVADAAVYIHTNAREKRAWTWRDEVGGVGRRGRGSSRNQSRTFWSSNSQFFPSRNPQNLLNSSKTRSPSGIFHCILSANHYIFHDGWEKLGLRSARPFHIFHYTYKRSRKCLIKFI